MSVIFRLLYGYILEKKNLIDNIAKDDMRQIICKSTKCNLIKVIIAVISSLPFDIELGSAQVNSSQVLPRHSYRPRSFL